MSQEMNMNEKPKLERKKTPLRQLNADKTTIPRDDQLGGQSYGEASIAKGAFDPSKPITDKPAGQGRTVEITEVEYRFPEAGKEKYGEGMPKGDFSDKPMTKDAEWTEDQQKPGIMQEAKDKVRHGVEKAKEAFTSDKPMTKDAEWTEGQQKPGIMQEAKDKVRYGVEKAKEAFTSDKPTTTTTTTPDSELTENKPGVIERVKGVFTGSSKDSGYTDQSKPGVIQGAKNMVWQGVEKAKGVFSSTSTKWTEPTELHPGNGYDWKRVVGDQGQVRWVATNDWSGDSANRGGIIAGAKDIVRSGVEKAKGVFVSKDAKESEYTDYDQSLTQDQSKPGVLQGAKEKVLQGVGKAKSMFSSSSAPSNESHPGKSYTWHKTTGDQGQTHWVARGDWSNDSAAQQSTPGVLQGAKEKVMQGVEKAKGVFSSSKPADSATAITPPADVPTVLEQQPVQGLGYKKIEIEKEHTPSGYGREKMTVEKSADPHYKNQTGFKEQTGTYSS